MKLESWENQYISTENNLAKLLQAYINRNLVIMTWSLPCKHLAAKYLLSPCKKWRENTKFEGILKSMSNSNLSKSFVIFTAANGELQIDHADFSFVEWKQKKNNI